MKKARWLTGLYANKPHQEKNRDRQLWRLVTPLIFEAGNGAIYEVPTGFETDFASVPRLPMLYALFGDTAHAAAVVHDYLCRVYYPQCMISWRAAADVFLEAMEASGIPAWRRIPMYWAVRLYRGPQPIDCLNDDGGL